ncbi:hypothetical protein N7448_001873 [Penicillium atrosanguineum]|uniref:Uncharacterized protein n=1 Tax=Penicillium atrosanguineum TaxID=1132637 RepID=A0A9W9Q7C8_9EURO|nr:glutathione-dependent formaldehyde-activating enzyme [Penicillium atrosanguineum]KAJ5133098.1 hypothetical protein N7526_004463 [Penicillium atrosanguineum]KAJ5150295.1 hypothetical protein N7448_001873 [Penicillium atrosanguineum]KAJ5305611.1 glutathione-dependent formaldehyde-activating enzyme [Penicillium atrosanguineum]KAJ5325073.1 hypothetical protein N7476_003673 [Penicillium atrosanguineum]
MRGWLGIVVGTMNPCSRQRKAKMQPKWESRATQLVGLECLEAKYPWHIGATHWGAIRQLRTGPQ